MVMLAVIILSILIEDPYGKAMVGNAIDCLNKLNLDLLGRLCQLPTVLKQIWPK